MTEAPAALNILHIYTRVSTAVQAEQGTSLESQRELGIAKAQDLGFDYKVWNEGGKSSHHEEIAERPVLSELFTAMKVGQIKHLWVYDQSRLSRNDQVASAFRYQFAKQGVTLYTKDGVFDLSNPNDRLFKQMLDALAEFDNVTRAERTRLGKLNRVRTGRWHGGPPPFGYKLEDKKLSIAEDEAKWVKRIFQEIVKGSSAIHVKQVLDTNGVSTRRQRGLWTIGSINSLLKNTHYAGYYHYEDKKSGQKIQVQCPSILDATTWNAAQHKRSNEVLRQSQKNATVKHFYLLRDFMYCAHCGRPLSGRIIKTRGESSYYCPNKEREWAKNGGSAQPWKRGTGCGFSRAMNIAQTDQLVWESVKTLHQNSCLLKEEVKNRFLTQGGVKIRSNAEIRDIESKIRRFQRQHKSMSETLGNLEANRLISQFNDTSYAVTTSRVNDEINRLESEIAKLRLELQDTAESRKWVNWLKAFGDEINDLDLLPEEKRKDYLGGLIKRIDVAYRADEREHLLTLTMQLPIVSDGIKYTGNGKGVQEYMVVPGSDTMTIASKKKDGRG